MNIFEAMEQYGHEELVFWYDQAAGLKAIVAIHDTTLGPALGGLRMWPYDSEDDAITDVMRLSRGMTYKNAAMGLDLGGGKSVIWADSRHDKTEARLRSFGRLIQSLGGRYITAEDVGVNADDMAVVARETEFVGGLKETSGDPSPATALGVLEGMKAAMMLAFGSADFHGRRIAIQGLGHVGTLLGEMLKNEGATLIVTDIHEDEGRVVADRLGAQWVAPDAIYGVDADVFAPCALGAIINDRTIDQFKCRVIAGSANNQLQEPRHGLELMKRGIVYVPDYVINGGGVVNVADEFHRDGYNQERAYARVRGIGKQVQEILQHAQQAQIPTQEAADQVAEARIHILGRVDSTYIPE
ncbi:Glu/Leu/Phe/Val dehydrogenase dimerization domain-containing protein [Sulfobacillus sp. hq2]|uniref:Leucine dehydrogenase n=1 Tax=Sulfobacillus thermotolerans TaxID=338644 RepID=A0ABM6RQF3_9FIRM|nr:Glu/Leu/Phe/Val dehydrogenase dimerization domain-containing protein [Sulfobacillus sp. hq2]AUW93535.1 leucine dehydrogenase [Sulfobacillus thermotolerans]MCY0907890.1 Glu/Leu/Phe/Val dehydrogenase [Sulfobacillus thermotolerans]POB10779.1 leucine dehydrogenase [Sulfobacillus sp. hq2]